MPFHTQVSNIVKNLRLFSSDHEKYVAELLDRIIRHYSGNLVSLVIFGSYARRENRLTSDLDILIILKKAKSRGERIREFVECVEMPLEMQAQKLADEGIFVDISPIILSTMEAGYFNPLYLDMLEHAVIVVDRDGFFKNIIERVREKVEEWGSYREYFGNRWVWVVKKGGFVGGVRLG